MGVNGDLIIKCSKMLKRYSYIIRQKKPAQKKSCNDSFNVNS